MEYEKIETAAIPICCARNPSLQWSKSLALLVIYGVHDAAGWVPVISEVL